MRALVVIKRLHIVLTTCLFVFLELAAHERFGLLQSCQTQAENCPIKVNDLHQESKRRDLVHHSTVIVDTVGLVRLNIHDIVAVEIIVSEPKVALSIRKSKHHLRDPCNVLLGFGVELDQIIESSLTDFHDSRHHRYIRKCCPRKRLIFFLRTFFVICSVRTYTRLNVIDIILG